MHCYIIPDKLHFLYTNDEMHEQVQIWYWNKLKLEKRGQT